MKFKLDENMPQALLEWLRERNHDAHSVADEGLSGAGDPLVLASATAECRVLLTFDLDFADARFYPPGTHAGIVIFRLPDQRWPTLQLYLANLLEHTDLVWLVAGLTIVQEDKIRHRKKNIRDPILSLRAAFQIKPRMPYMNRPLKFGCFMAKNALK